MIKPIEITQEHYKSGTAELAMKLNQVIDEVNAICSPPIQQREYDAPNIDNKQKG